MATNMDASTVLSELPQEVYDLLVDRFGAGISVEDIWLENRDEGDVCIVEVHSLVEDVVQALVEIESRLKLAGVSVRFIVREPRVTNTSFAHLSHPSCGRVRTLRGPFHRFSDRPALLLVSTPEPPLSPDSGWDATFQTPWDEITLHGAQIKKSGSVTGLESSRVSVVHRRG
ncbi:MAG: hypothetical protein HY815_28605 [Candidatus Riflebacteria bacterium]|nr:hypothetical protein [Candidatus Riflebacteria bacterium]